MIGPARWVVMMVMVMKVHGFSDGGVKVACNNMQPAGHRVNPQTSSHPYTIQITPSQGYYVRVSGEQFKGFMVQAHDDNGNQVGQFMEPRNVIAKYHTQTCVSHADPSPKTVIDLYWEPGTHTGNVKFVGTVVKNFNTYWTGVNSPVLDIPN